MILFAFTADEERTILTAIAMIKTLAVVGLLLILLQIILSVAKGWRLVTIWSAITHTLDAIKEYSNMDARQKEDSRNRLLSKIGATVGEKVAEHSPTIIITQPPPAPTIPVPPRKS